MKLGPLFNKLDQQNLSLWGINLVGMLGLLNQWVKLLMPLPPLLLIQLALLQWVLVQPAFDQLDPYYSKGPTILRGSLKFIGGHAATIIVIVSSFAASVLMLLKLVLMDLLSSFPS